MKSKTILFLTFLFLCRTADCLGTEEATKHNPDRPDILFILLDDLRWDGLSFMGHPYVKTPQIDKLRAMGANMRNAFVTTSICCPSRATYLTGMYANQHGVIDNETSEYNPDITPPLTKNLQEAGYCTAMIGKWHMGKTARPRRYFDHWISFKGQGKYFDPLFNINGKTVQDKGYTTDILTDRAIEFIQEQPKNRPYFMMLSHKAVHEPFLPAPRHKDAFGANTKDLEPVSWSTDFRNKPEWQRRQRVRDFRWDWRTREVEEETIPETIEPQAWEERNRAVEQFRCVAAVDDGVGRVVEALRKRGTLDNTVIIFTSDNGYFHMEHRRWDKRVAYEEGLRIPMIIVFPGRIKPNSSVSQMVSNIDFAPTVLSYAGVPVPKQMQGLSMKPLFEQENPEWRDNIFYEYWVDLVHEIPTMVAVRTDRYKLVQYPEIEDLDELYDLETDPHELNNLSVDPQFAELHNEMKERLKRAAKEYGWRPNVFPKNLPRIRGTNGMLLDLKVENGQLTNATGRRIEEKNVNVNNDAIHFNGNESVIEVPFNQDIDPSTWPYKIDINVKPETDGVIAMQSGKRNGYKLFVQDGRPGLSILCKTWIALHTTIDSKENILGKWTHLEAYIDYNRVTFSVDGQVVESRALPQPFKGKTKAPLLIGSVGEHTVSDKVPHNPFKGEIRSVRIRRELVSK